MIENSVLNNEKIVELVREKYNIEINQITKLNRGSANLYSLNDNEYILKEFQSKYTRDEIEKEIKIINHLQKDNIPVPDYLKTIDGNYSFIYEEKVIIMQKFIAEYTIESNTANYNQVIESAEYLGKIVKSLSTLDFDLPNTDVSEWYSHKTINESIEKQKKLLEKVNKDEEPQIYEDLKCKIDMLIDVRDNFDFNDMNKVSVMNTHGDYSLLQFIYENEKINAIIDFVSACKMPIVWEIIRSYSYIDPEAKEGQININNLIDYTRTFSKYVLLNEYDLKYMSYLYLVQLLSSTFGYKQYIADNSKKELLKFAYFRTKLCKNLYENADNITNALIDELLNNK